MIVFAANKASEVVANVPLPGVFTAPIRPDVVHHVYRDMAKNRRQAYAVHSAAGHQVAAISWGTGRAVSRIPRVNGGGTHRAGQGAFGNMCRGGRMFAPTKTWRKWHRKINLNQRRFALVSAIAASAVAPLVMARGHRVEKVAEIPLVLSNDVESVKKTKEAAAILAAHGAHADVDRVIASRRLRAGKGKMRNRRYVQRRGPLVIYLNDNGVSRAFRNLPGVETCSVERLNLLQLAPGGHIGRFVIWSQAAFEHLEALYGSQTAPSTLKNNYHLPRAILSSTDISRIINSEEIQSVVRPAKQGVKLNIHRRKNPLVNNTQMYALNPYVIARKRAIIKAAEAQKAGRKVSQKKKRFATQEKAQAAARAKRAFYRQMVGYRA
ncbi:uncharacterized protein AMSG_05004 [Thecamonas trahens ATCC 50062]|uniref:Large ribosomal subunit protein uL4 C-terminal domain-containing protein n=1 Tax=Thecamonas trahens ATCC 50062 TaxID=461836 RepID=A0A0L0D9M8_THETB|nr:hypothetical protein AMSG_05004 [Thecamonas trahens ATCC 50062]KNC49044.1 hypothetical protein AMSG_05004 [Thecamonas trahens ATCC 50062]|eukprot:XP_013758079.1 hypothetical protein AMSG_05004 [Thecamonas trahens ATCC 50062]